MVQLSSSCLSNTHNIRSNWLFRSGLLSSFDSYKYKALATYSFRILQSLAKSLHSVKMQISSFFIVLLAIVLCISTTMGKFYHISSIKIDVCSTCLIFLILSLMKGPRTINQPKTQGVLLVFHQDIAELDQTNMLTTKIAKNANRDRWVTVMAIQICLTPKMNVKMLALDRPNRMLCISVD